MPTHSWAYVEEVTVHCRFPTWNMLTWNLHSITSRHWQARSHLCSKLFDGQDCNAMKRFPMFFCAILKFFVFKFNTNLHMSISHKPIQCIIMIPKLVLALQWSLTCIPIEHQKRIWLGILLQKGIVCNELFFSYQSSSSFIWTTLLMTQSKDNTINKYVLETNKIHCIIIRWYFFGWGRK